MKRPNPIGFPQLIGFFFCNPREFTYRTTLHGNIITAVRISVLYYMLTLFVYHQILTFVI